MKRYFLLIFLIALFSAGSVAAVEISAGFSQATLSKNEVLVTDKAFSLAQVQAIPFLPAEKTQINLKPGESVWMRVRIDSQMATNISLVARYEFPWTDRAEFFVLRQTGEVVAYSLGGDAVQGPRAERLPLVRFELRAHESLWLYLKVSTLVRAAAQINLYSHEDLSSRVFIELLGQGLFIGVVCMLLFFHLNMYVATRDPVLRKYLAYLLSVSLFIPLRSGILPQFLFGNYAHLSDMIWVFLVSATYFTAVSFARALLSLRMTDPRVDRVLYGIQLLTLAPAFILLFGRREAFIAENIAALFVGPPLLLLGIHHVLLKRNYALYFVIGYSVPIIAAITDNLVENGVIPAFPGRNEMLPAAMLFEFLLFAQIIYRKLADSEISRVKDQERLTRFRSELAFASAIQKSLLPPMQQVFGAVEVRAAYRSEKAVGNDYFDVFQADENSIGVLLVDAGAGRGASLAAALDTSAVRMAFRNSFSFGAEPVNVMQRMFAMLEPVTRARQVAVTYIKMNTLTGAGEAYWFMNPDPVIVRASGMRGSLSGDEAENAQASIAGFQLQQGDALVVATAGLARRVDLTRDKLTLPERIEKIQNRSQANTARTKRRPREDMTLVALQYRGQQR